MCANANHLQQFLEMTCFRDGSSNGAAGAWIVIRFGSCAIGCSCRFVVSRHIVRASSKGMRYVTEIPHVY